MSDSNQLTGALFTNDGKAPNDKRPDYTGPVEFDSGFWETVSNLPFDKVLLKVAAWKNNRNGKNYLSLVISVDEYKMQKDAQSQREEEATAQVNTETTVEGAETYVKGSPTFE